MKLKTFFALAAVLSALFLSSCSQNITVLSDNTFALDTIIQIKLYYKNDKDADENLIDEAFQLLHYLLLHFCKMAL